MNSPLNPTSPRRFDDFIKNDISLFEEAPASRRFSSNEDFLKLNQDFYEDPALKSARQYSMKPRGIRQESGSLAQLKHRGDLDAFEIERKLSNLTSVPDVIPEASTGQRKLSNLESPDVERKLSNLGSSSVQRKLSNLSPGLTSDSSGSGKVKSNLPELENPDSLKSRKSKDRYNARKGRLGFIRVQVSQTVADDSSSPDIDGKSKTGKKLQSPHALDGTDDLSCPDLGNSKYKYSLKSQLPNGTMEEENSSPISATCSENVKNKPFGRIHITSPKLQAFLSPRRKAVTFVG